MAQGAGLASAFLCASLLASQAFSADTGMLYVKSEPPGATVVIDGTERGKTPVLVRGLPAGEVTVELRLAGVEPVTRKVAVEANRVANVNVDIDVSDATLTVISDPLEATVILDARERGRTPLTLEHLAHGRHEIILLKAGHPRTARSIHLKPGEKRVLEVKLGTAGEPEHEGPASPRKAEVGPDAGPDAGEDVPVGVQLILTVLRQAVEKGNYAETRTNLRAALGQPEMAEFKSELRAAIEVVRALEDRRDAMVRAADGLVGKEASLGTKKGVRKGRVDLVSREGLTIVSTIMINGRPAGETRATVKWAALAPEEQSRLAGSWKPTGPTGAVAEALLAEARKDEAAAARAVASARDHPLGKYVAWKAESPGKPSKETAREEWNRIENRCRARRVSGAEALALEKDVLAFRKKHEATKAASPFRRRMGNALLHARRASGLEAHWTFDEGRGTVARDSSGWGRHGKIIGGSRWAEGKIDGALDLDGSSGHVDCGSASGLGAAGDITVAAWVLADSFKGPGGSYTGIVSYGKAKDVIGSLSLKSDGTANKMPVFEIQDGKGTYTPAQGGALKAGSWHHLAGVVHRNAIRLYLDGSEAALASFPGTKRSGATHKLTIGRDLYADQQDRFFDGRIDEVRIYGRALGAEEVAALAALAE